MRNCTCSVCHGVRYTVKNILHIFKIYGWILDAYIVDFFQEDLWSKLPKSWTQILEKITPEELGLWILNESKSPKVWPLSLLALRELIKILGIDRNPLSKTSLVCCSLEWNYHLIEHGSDEFNKTITEKELIQGCENILVKHVKVKKRYEIDKFSEICAKCAFLSQCKCIVDTGAGMGHLARQLTYKYNLPVICIEQAQCLSDLAKKYDNEFLYSLKKYIPNHYFQSSHHLCAKIEKENCSSQLIDTLDEIFTNKFQLKSINNKYGLIGLHPCGDLAATLLKIYIKQDTIKFISVVGCCYMKLTVDDDDHNGYPLSEYIINTPDHSLNYAALEVACHAVENYCDKMKNGQYDDLKVHAYRALLEMILINKNGSCMKHGRVKNVKVTDKMSFVEYCKLATSKFSCDKRIVDSDIDSLKVQSSLKRWHQVVAFEAIRMMLAPLVETVVLLDRFLFLSENGLKPLLKAEFDPRRSPRNFVLISIK
ncbi:protein RRNAD1-like [Chelonus insularis]|uniref:protein RRNAD1-like n=1 Tax=Chelonus insularis TaxID=460826 RepID=UPI00158943AD|nr:protein RRNAD1-like [Chelonus insularis]